MSEEKNSSKFHFTIDFGEDLTLEQAEQYLKSPLAETLIKIEDVGIATDRLLEIHVTPKESELLYKRAIYEETYIGALVEKIIQKSLNEWEKEEKK